jgi:hypothetical protein
VITRKGLNEARPVIHDLDTLPWPAWDLFPLEEVYFKNSSSLFSEEAHLAQRRIDINGSFGCSLICRYCWHLGTTGDMLVENNGAETMWYSPTGEIFVITPRGTSLRWWPSLNAATA